MKRALVVGSALLLGLTTVVACVDLFHDTDSLFVDGGGTALADGDPLPDSSGPPTLACTSNSAAALTTAETACAWLGACAMPFGVNEPGTCMLQGLRAYDCSFDRSNAPRAERAELWRCLQEASEAKSCDAVRRCALPGALFDQTCASSNDFFQCVGQGTSRNRVFCRASSGKTVPFTGAENCAAAGGTCIERNGSAACSTTVDGFGFGEPCTRSSCQSTSLSLCDGTGDAGVEVTRIDCTQSGSGTCGSGTDEGPGCIASTLVDGSVCTPDKAVSCRGTTATRCRNSVLEEVACGNAGLACDSEGAELTYEGCRGSASDGGDGGSTGASCAPKCDTAGNVVACMNGKEVVLECGAQGLGNCVERKSTALAEPPGYACRAPGEDADAAN